MKEKWLNWRELIIDDRDLSFGAKAIGLYLNTYMNSKNDFAYPSIKTICDEMSITDKTACKYINDLVKFGYIAKQKRFSNSVIYHTTIPEKIKKQIASIGNRPLMDEILTSIGNEGATVSEGFRPNKQDNKQDNKQGGNFEVFWESYPKKVDRKKAELAFNRLSLVKQKKAMADIKNRYGNTDKQFIPNPTKYISGDRWEDEITETKDNSYLGGGNVV